MAAQPSAPLWSKRTRELEEGNLQSIPIKALNEGFLFVSLVFGCLLWGSGEQGHVVLP